MKVLLSLLLPSTLAVQAAQIPLHSLMTADDDSCLSSEAVVQLLNKVNSESGLFLGSDRNNVTLHLGDRHVSYQSSRLILRNTSETHPDTTWQVRFDNDQDQNKASICAHLPSFASRCWDAGSGGATVGSYRSARYFPTRVGTKLVFWENNYCLAVSADDYTLSWVYDSECTHFTMKSGHTVYSSPRGLKVGQDGISIQQHGATGGERIDDLAYMVMWDPFTALAGAVVKTIGTAINVVAPNSQAATNARLAGDAWGYCGPSQPC